MGKKLMATMLNASGEVLNERLRQNKLWGVQTLTNAQRLAIVMEEMGEVAEACQASLGIETRKPTDSNDLKKELIHLSAVSLAWIEQLNEESKEK